MAETVLCTDGALLGLSKEEYIFLFDVMRVIGGSKSDTRRKHAESILNALEKNRLEMGPVTPVTDMRGTVVFMKA